jgi:hypothetical protein
MPGSARELSGKISVPLLSQVQRLFGNRGPGTEDARTGDLMGGALKYGYRLAWVLVREKRLLANPLSSV